MASIADENVPQAATGKAAEHTIVFEQEQALDPQDINVHSPRLFQRDVQDTKEIDLVIHAFQEMVKNLEQKHEQKITEVEAKWKRRFELLEANVLRQNYQNAELRENLASTALALPQTS